MNGVKTMGAFEDAVRALARSEGFELAGDPPVEVEMKSAWSGYSEYTITNEWDCFTVRCGLFERTYENEYENRQTASDAPTVVALAKLWDDLAKVTVSIPRRPVS